MMSYIALSSADDYLSANCMSLNKYSINKRLSNIYALPEFKDALCERVIYRLKVKQWQLN